MCGLHLLHLRPELLNLLKFVLLHKVHKFNALQQVLFSFLLLRFDADLSDRSSQQVQRNCAVFASVEAQSYLFRPIVDNQIYEVVNVYAIENLSYWWLTMISTSSKITKEKIYSLKHCKCISQCLQWPLNQLLKLISLLLSDILPLLYELHFLFLFQSIKF